MQQQMLALQAERDALKETVAGVQASLEQLNVDREETLRTLGAAAGNAEGWKQKHDELTRLLAEQQAQHKASLLTATASNRVRACSPTRLCNHGLLPLLNVHQRVGVA